MNLHFISPSPRSGALLWGRMCVQHHLNTHQDLVVCRVRAATKPQSPSPTSPPPRHRLCQSRKKYSSPGNAAHIMQMSTSPPRAHLVRGEDLSNGARCHRTDWSLLSYVFPHSHAPPVAIWFVHSYTFAPSFAAFLFARSLQLWKPLPCPQVG